MPIIFFIKTAYGTGVTSSSMLSNGLAASQKHLYAILGWPSDVHNTGKR